MVSCQLLQCSYWRLTLIALYEVIGKSGPGRRSCAGSFTSSHSNHLLFQLQGEGDHILQMELHVQAGHSLIDQEGLGPVLGRPPSTIRVKVSYMCAAQSSPIVPFYGTCSSVTIFIVLSYH